MSPRLICLIGAECTGKTTLAQALAAQMGGLWVPEYLRTFCDRHARTPHKDEQLGILQEQVQGEARAWEAARHAGQAWVFCDTAPLLTAVYSEQVFGDTSLYPQARNLHARYALTLLLQPDIAWVADGLQREGRAAQARVQQRLEHELFALGAPVCLVHGVAATRQRLAMDAVAALNG